MYTTDEWGNTVLHIQTGRKGMELFKEVGFTNTMTSEEYKKHMDSYRRLEKERQDNLMAQIEKLFKELSSNG